MTPEATADMVARLVKVYKLDEQGTAEFLALLTEKLFGGTAQAPTQKPWSGPVSVAAMAPTPPQASASTQSLPPGGAVWIMAGGTCTCKGCHKPVYLVTRDVHERVKAEDLFAAFEPLNGAPALTDGTSIYGDQQGNLAIDCPLCKGTKTLWIRGDGVYEELPGGAGV